MELKYNFPVQRLFQNITEDLKKYPSFQIKEIIDSGLLINTIKPLEIGQKCICVAEIKRRNNPETLEFQYQVELSAAYCQYLWILCDVILRTIDYFISLATANEEGINKESLIRSNEILTQLDNNHILAILHNNNMDTHPEHFRMQLERMNELLKDEDFLSRMDKELALALSFIDYDGPSLKRSEIGKLSMDDGYGLVTNSCFIKGISFILLHELSHIQNDDLSLQPTLQDENNADFTAFWNMYLDINEEEKFTTMIGIICMLFSLVIKDFGSQEDNIHLREDIRLFQLFDNFSGENNKYSWILIYLFNIWAKIKQVQDFPILDMKDINGVQKIKDYFNI